MTIAIDSTITGTVFLRAFDEGIFRTMGAVVKDTANGDQYQLTVLGATAIQVPVYFGKPEQHFQKKVFPFITVDRDMNPAMSRWMGVGQLQYRAGIGTPIVIGGVSGSQPFVSGGGYNIGLPAVSGFAVYQELAQAIPYDITYTISCWDRYEGPIQFILQKLLKVFQPTSTLNVVDSMGLPRTYDMFNEAGPTPLHEVVDAVTRARGYAITVRVQAELDLNDPVVAMAVSGFGLSMFRLSPQDP